MFKFIYANSAMVDEVIYILCGIVCIMTGIRGLKNKKAPIGTFVFWTLLGILFGAGKFIIDSFEYGGALEDKELLKKVTEFKMKFYPRKWARYEDALVGKLKLVPRECRFSEIEKDYKAMEEMIYGEYPKFDEIIKVLKELEKEINK